MLCSFCEKQHYLLNKLVKAIEMNRLLKNTSSLDLGLILYR